jgi:hypothetical protein
MGVNIPQNNVCVYKFEEYIFMSKFCNLKIRTKLMIFRYDFLKVSFKDRKNWNAVLSYIVNVKCVGMRQLSQWSINQIKYNGQFFIKTGVIKG